MTMMTERLANIQEHVPLPRDPDRLYTTNMFSVDDIEAGEQNISVLAQKMYRAVPTQLEHRTNYPTAPRRMGRVSRASGIGGNDWWSFSEANLYCLYLRDCVTYVCRNMAALAPLEMAGIMPVCLTTCTDSELYAIKHPSSTPISIDSQRLQPIYPQHCAASIRTKCCGSFLLPIRLLLLSDLKILYHIVRPAPPLDR